MLGRYHVTVFQHWEAEMEGSLGLPGQPVGLTNSVSSSFKEEEPPKRSWVIEDACWCWLLASTVTHTCAYVQPLKKSGAALKNSVLEHLSNIQKAPKFSVSTANKEARAFAYIQGLSPQHWGHDSTYLLAQHSGARGMKIRNWRSSLATKWVLSVNEREN